MTARHLNLPLPASFNSYTGDTSTSSLSFHMPPPCPFPVLSGSRAIPFPLLPPSAPDLAHEVPPQAAELQAVKLN